MNSYQEYCAKLQKKHQLRQLNSASPTYKIDFSSNDYLNLSKNPKLLEGAIEAGKKYGVGATGSRLLSGNCLLFEELEKQIAKDKGTEQALIFPSGYQANVSALSSLLDKTVLRNQALVFFDKANHSSLYQGTFLALAEIQRYNHNDLEHLEELLERYRHDSRPKFIVTESIFGMDGDITPIAKIVNAAAQHQAFIYLDEAHATGLVGQNGYGLSTEIDWQNVPHIIMGTFSKALGCMGGYIATSDELAEYLRNKASGFIYSTAVSPIVIGAAKVAWSLVAEFSAERKRIHQHADFFRKELMQLGFDVGYSNSHIIPIIIGNENDTIALQQKLLRQGVAVSAIRPPTVQPGRSSLRIALNSGHSIEDILYCLECLK